MRRVVLRRKMSGQIQGGLTWMDRQPWFMTCIMTWRQHGRSVMD